MCALLLVLGTAGRGKEHRPGRDRRCRRRGVRAGSRPHGAGEKPGDNAIRYTPEGGRVDIAVGNEHGLVTLQVDDTGPGIPAGERERVFDSFYRVLGNGELGSGLGLAITRTVAASIGATIELGDARPPQSGTRALVTFKRLS